MEFEITEDGIFRIKEERGEKNQTKSREGLTITNPTEVYHKLKGALIRDFPSVLSVRRKEKMFFFSCLTRALLLEFLPPQTQLQVNHEH